MTLSYFIDSSWMFIVLEYSALLISADIQEREVYTVIKYSRC